LETSKEKPSSDMILFCPLEKKKRKEKKSLKALSLCLFFKKKKKLLLKKKDTEESKKEDAESCCCCGIGLAATAAEAVSIDACLADLLVALASEAVVDDVLAAITSKAALVCAASSADIIDKLVSNIAGRTCLVVLTALVAMISILSLVSICTALVQIALDTGTVHQTGVLLTCDTLLLVAGAGTADEASVAIRAALIAVALDAHTVVVELGVLRAGGTLALVLTACAAVGKDISGVAGRAALLCTALDTVLTHHLVAQSTGCTLGASLIARAAVGNNSAGIASRTALVVATGNTLAVHHLCTLSTGEALCLGVVALLADMSVVAKEAALVVTALNTGTVDKLETGIAGQTVGIRVHGLTSIAQTTDVVDGTLKVRAGFLILDITVGLLGDLGKDVAVKAVEININIIDLGKVSKHLRRKINNAVFAQTKGSKNGKTSEGILGDEGEVVGIELKIIKGREILE